MAARQESEASRLPDAMNIGQAARASGVSAKMIRHYESLGLIPEADRTDAGYRRYTPADVHVLRFVARARDLGFSIPQIAELVGLWQDRERPSAKVKRLALEHVRELERKVARLLEMKATLEHLAACCHGDQRPDCPILEGLAAERPTDGECGAGGGAGACGAGPAASVTAPAAPARRSRPAAS